MRMQACMCVCVFVFGVMVCVCVCVCCMPSTPLHGSAPRWCVCLSVLQHVVRARVLCKLGEWALLRVECGREGVVYLAKYDHARAMLGMHTIPCDKRLRW